MAAGWAWGTSRHRAARHGAHQPSARAAPAARTAHTQPPAAAARLALAYASRSASSRSCCTRTTALGLGSSLAHRTSRISACVCAAGSPGARQVRWARVHMQAATSGHKSRRVAATGCREYNTAPPAARRQREGAQSPTGRTRGVAAAQRLLVHGHLGKLCAAAPLVPAANGGGRATPGSGRAGPQGQQVPQVLQVLQVGPRRDSMIRATLEARA